MQYNSLGFLGMQYEIENLYSNQNCFLKNKDIRSSKFTSNPWKNLYLLHNIQFFFTFLASLRRDVFQTAGVNCMLCIVEMQVNLVTTTSLQFEGQTCNIFLSKWDKALTFHHQCYTLHQVSIQEPDTKCGSLVVCTNWSGKANSKAFH